MKELSMKPYMIRALYEWCADSGYTPFIAVFVDKHTQVPMEFVRDEEIVLNIGFEATTNLNIGNEWIEFKARFSGIARELLVPVANVLAIYARENGEGMSFPVDRSVSRIIHPHEETKDSQLLPTTKPHLSTVTNENHEEHDGEENTPPQAPHPSSSKKSIFRVVT